MSDAFFQLLAQQAQSTCEPQLIIADENLKKASLQALSKTQTLTKNSITLITNRFDIGKQASSAGLDYRYSDFDFSGFPDSSFKQILYRVSKEKPVTHHIINHALRLIKPGGNLVLIGEKNDGIKTYTDKAGHYFGHKIKPKKQGNIYISVIQKLHPDGPALNDSNYHQLRQTVEIDNKPVFSKPGLFGWNKIDQGSAFLANYLPDFFQCLPSKPTSLLDLGCGYGYLSLMASKYNDAKIVATDNNAAAVTACSQNFLTFGINGKVVADSCAQSINQAFDTVLCNPPFHSGFGTDSQLTQQFVTSSYNHLKSGGKALFVANSFVPIESCAAKHAKPTGIEKVAENKRFKLIVISKE